MKNKNIIIGIVITFVAVAFSSVSLVEALEEGDGGNEFFSLLVYKKNIFDKGTFSAQGWYRNYEDEQIFTNPIIAECDYTQGSGGQGSTWQDCAPNPGYDEIGIHEYTSFIGHLVGPSLQDDFYDGVTQGLDLSNTRSVTVRIKNNGLNDPDTPEDESGYLERTVTIPNDDWSLAQVENFKVWLAAAENDAGVVIEDKFFLRTETEFITPDNAHYYSVELHHSTNAYDTETNERGYKAMPEGVPLYVTSRPSGGVMSALGVISCDYAYEDQENEKMLIDVFARIYYQSEFQGLLHELRDEKEETVDVTEYCPYVAPDPPLNCNVPIPPVECL